MKWNRNPAQVQHEAPSYKNTEDSSRKPLHLKKYLQLAMQFDYKLKDPVMLNWKNKFHILNSLRKRTLFRLVECVNQPEHQETKV